MLRPPCFSQCVLGQSHQTLCDPVDCNLPGTLVHGILQARIPEQVTPGALPDPGVEPMSLASPALILNHWATWETLGLQHANE